MKNYKGTTILSKGEVYNLNESKFKKLKVFKRVCSRCNEIYETEHHDSKVCNMCKKDKFGISEKDKKC